MKRSRSPTSPTPSWSSLDSDTQPNATADLARARKHIRPPDDSSAEPLIRCTIGPICSPSPQTFPTQAALQSHYVKAHSYVCRGLVPRDRARPRPEAGVLGDGDEASGEAEECGKVFPEERLLELVSLPLFPRPTLDPAHELIVVPDIPQRVLNPSFLPSPRARQHIIENHDPIALVRQSHGEKIFECLLPRDICSHRFSTPKDRRKHMVRKHHYSKQFFFSVVNHGIGGLLQRFGPGVSLVRPAWTPRSGPVDAGSSRGAGAGRGRGAVHPGSGGDAGRRGPREGRGGSGGSTDGSDASMDAYETHEPVTSHCEMQRHLRSTTSPRPPPPSAPTNRGHDEEMDDLARSLAGTALGFVPRGVRRKQRELERRKGEGEGKAGMLVDGG